MIVERVVTSTNALALEYVWKSNLMPVEVKFLYITRTMLRALVSDKDNAKFNFSRDFVRPALEFCAYLTQKEDATKAERVFIDSIIALHVEGLKGLSEEKKNVY